MLDSPGWYKSQTTQGTFIYRKLVQAKYNLQCKHKLYCSGLKLFLKLNLATLFKNQEKKSIDNKTKLNPCTLSMSSICSKNIIINK